GAGDATGDAKTQRPDERHPVGHDPEENTACHEASPVEAYEQPGGGYRQPPVQCEQRVAPLRGHQLDSRVGEEREHAEPDDGSSQRLPRADWLDRRTSGACGVRDPGPTAAVREESGSQQELATTDDHVAPAPEVAGADNGRGDQGSQGRAYAEGGVEPVEDPGAEVAGPVRVKSGVH